MVGTDVAPLGEFSADFDARVLDGKVACVVPIDETASADTSVGVFLRNKCEGGSEREVAELSLKGTRGGVGKPEG